MTSWTNVHKPLPISSSLAFWHQYSGWQGYKYDSLRLAVIQGSQAGKESAGKDVEIVPVSPSVGTCIGRCVPAFGKQAAEAFSLMILGLDLHCLLKLRFRQGRDKNEAGSGRVMPDADAGAAGRRPAQMGPARPTLGGRWGRARLSDDRCQCADLRRDGR